MCLVLVLPSDLSPRDDSDGGQDQACFDGEDDNVHRNWSPRVVAAGNLSEDYDGAT